MKPYYQDDFVTIWHGDCREILPDLPKVGAMITDPPYPNGEGHFTAGVEAAKEVLPTLLSPSQFVFWSEIEYPPCRLPRVAVHIWHRTNVNGKIYEPIYQHEADGRKRRSDIHRQAAIFNGAGAGCWEFLGHPTQKPIALMGWLISKSTATEILDPFMGIGATLRAAKDLGRKAIGIEIEEKYCEIAAKRMAQEVLCFA